MIESTTYKGKKFAKAREIYNWLEINKKFSDWFKSNCNRIGLVENIDFFPLKGQSTGGRPSMDYLLTKDSALDLCLVSGGKNANEVRKQLKEVFEEKQTGLLLNIDQISALTDMVKAMTLVSKQEEAEKRHYNFKDFKKHSEWWTYRAYLLGYSKSSLIEALGKIGKRYKSQKQALVNLDPAEIIRTGVIDLLIALGRDREYALNVAEFAKVIAEKNGYHRQIWDDTKENPLRLNQVMVNERKKLL